QIGEIVGPEERGDADLPLLGLLHQRIVEIVRVQHVGRGDAVELSPGELLDPRTQVGTPEAELGPRLVHLEGGGAVLELVDEVVDARVAALERAADPLAKLDVPPDRAGPGGVDVEIQESLRTLPGS